MEQIFTSKKAMLLLVIGFINCFCSISAQHINGGSGQGLVALVPNKFEDKHEYKNIRPDVHAGFWQIRVVPVKWAWEGLQVTYEIDINQPTLVRGANADGGEHDYDISQFNLAISGSMEFMIEGDYTNPNTQEKVSFTKTVYAPNLGSNMVTGSELFGYSGNVTNFKSAQEIINYLKIEIRSIKALNKHISGYQRIDIDLGNILKEKRTNNYFNNLLADAKNAESFDRIDDAIQYYQKAYDVKNDPAVKAKIEELKARQKESIDKKESEELVSQAHEAENRGDLEKAKQLYQQAADKSGSPSLKEDIARINNKIATQKAETQQIDQQQSLQQNSNQSTQLDFWGNPVTTNNSNVTTTNSGNNNAAKKAAWEQEEALKRQRVDNYNANLIEQSNDIYQQSLSIDKDMNDALSQISPETYGDPKAMIQTGMNLLNTANGNLGQAYTGAALGGVGLAAGLLGDLAKAKAKKEAAAERARIRKEAEAKKQAIRESIKKARVAVFNGYPQGELPLSSTTSKGNNLYYFVYAYNQDQLMLDNPKVKATNVFAIGKYPDGTWPMKTKLESEINALTPLNETICGPFYSQSEASSVYQSFVSYLDKTNMGMDTISYEGFNAHSETENLQQSAPKLDFWGNPIKN
ncbi:hypothetical protein ACFO5O_00045 [Geojedonia litorea]|uniref:Tetratricopeptide repeat protein n=1 Tax=Geojedonia litorea TaxID=1268269 RepID=A0ABV9MXG0_9FLAO